MRKTLKIILPVFVLLLAAVSCNLPFTPTPAPEEVDKQAATAVAQTLTALAPTATTETPPIPTETPTAEPLPSLTALPDAPLSLRVAFTDRSQNLWVWQSGSEPLQLLNSGDISNVTLSPDGEWIAFMRATPEFTEMSLWSIRFDGSSERLLVSQGEFMDMPVKPSTNPDLVVYKYPYKMEFIPNSNTMLAFLTITQFEGPGFITNDDLWLVDVATGARSNPLPAGSGGVYEYSPDGSQIAIITPSDISLVNADGSNRRSSVLTYTPVLTYSESPYYAVPQWAPDGSFLRVAVPYYDPMTDPDMPGQIYQLPTDGSPAVFIANLGSGGSFSPDLSKFAYHEGIDSIFGGESALFVSNYDGSGAVEYVRGSIGFGGWAPDSIRFAYLVYTPRTHYFAQVGDTTAIPLDGGDTDALRWIDNDHFIYTTIGTPNWGIYYGSVGAPGTLIADLGAGDRFPDYDFTVLP